MVECPTREQIRAAQLANLAASAALDDPAR
jgi:hypothetical protein